MLKVKIYEPKDNDVKPISTDHLNLLKTIELKKDSLPKNNEMLRAIQTKEKLKVGAIFSIENDNITNFYRIKPTGVISYKIEEAKRIIPIENIFENVNASVINIEEVDEEVDEEFDEYQQSNDSVMEEKIKENIEKPKVKVKVRVSLIDKIEEMKEKVRIRDAEKNNKK